MDTLSTSYIKQYYYVNDGVIYDIKGYGKDNDVCVINSDKVKDKIPYVEAQNGTDATTKKKYYLDIYIEDGDTYNKKEGDQQTPNGMFKKTIHGGEEEESVSFPEYYKTLCLEQIKKTVLLNFDKDSEWFMDNISKTGVPEFMISGAGYSITASTAIDQIDVLSTDEKLATYKETIAKEEVIKAAKVRAESLGYELVETGETCEDHTNIVIEKKS